jgi:hypothetical protein
MQRLERESTETGERALRGHRDYFTQSSQRTEASLVIHMIHVNCRAHSPTVVSEAVGLRLRAGMDREARRITSAIWIAGACDPTRLSIHVPAPQGPAPTAGQETPFSVISV